MEVSQKWHPIQRYCEESPDTYRGSTIADSDIVGSFSSILGRMHNSDTYVQYLVYVVELAIKMTLYLSLYSSFIIHRTSLC